MGAGQLEEMDADRIEERLFYEVRNTKHDDIFTGASAVDLFLAIHRGVENMVTEERTRPNDVEEATEQLRILLAEMDAARASRGVTAFQEETVSMAFQSLCPKGFWPFC
jgi:hypothetical protein